MLNAGGDRLRRNGLRLCPRDHPGHRIRDYRDGAPGSPRDDDMVAQFDVAMRQLGGDTVLRALVARFYHHMASLPEAAAIRAMHAEDLGGAEEKLFMFLSGWLGGPQRFVERYGHPRLRARHLPFAIDRAARDQWLLCMAHALQDTVTDKPLADALFAALSDLADHMRNQPG